jgi:hypothetical protein
MTPYDSLPEQAFWASGVARRNPLEVTGLWTPKFPITRAMPIATYGSCFAQHFSRALVGRGFTWLDGEPAPRGLAPEAAAKFNYGIFSARTANIYTVGLLRQWISWASGEAPVPDEIWEQGGRFYDPFRPRIEPDGFASPEELLASRQMVLEGFLRSITDAKLFVFTLGLTESWINSELGHEYPMCPGTAAGTFDPERHQFVNRSVIEVHRVLRDCLKRIRQINPAIRVLLTVSPVPLTATASGKHVLVATMQSKSILRAVAGMAADELPFVDYFPSYEIINAPTFRGGFYEPNQRSVAQAGVNHVMGEFFRCLVAAFPDAMAEGRPRKDPGRGAPRAARKAALPGPGPEEGTEDDLVCEEALLAAFAPKDSRA